MQWATELAVALGLLCPRSAWGVGCYLFRGMAAAIQHLQSTSRLVPASHTVWWAHEARTHGQTVKTP